MKSLDNIAEDLFNKIRGRFPSVTIGDAEGKVINDPLAARFFDFDFKEGDKNLGKVSISVTEDSLAVMYSNNFVENEDSVTKKTWYNFLRELRSFAKKRLLSFDTRDITKSNLDKRDYKFLAQQQGGDAVMSESKLYGTSRVSYQDIGTARLNIRHTESIDQAIAGGRAKKIGAIYIESSEGERFKYPYKHLSGARAMARHVAEGGKPFDEFGKHITSLSEEMYKLRKFKTYMGRSAVMAESLSEYMDVVKDRITTVKKTIESLQKPNTYKQAFESFEVPVLEDVPEDVAENWIDQLTIRQFNEELKDVFPYIYKLVSEASKADEITPENVDEGFLDALKSAGKAAGNAIFGDPEEEERQIGVMTAVLKANGYEDNKIRRLKNGCLNDPRVCLYNEIKKKNLQTGDMDQEVAKIGDELNSGLTTMSGTVDEGERHGNDSIYDKCWDGYERVPGTKRGEPGSCRKKTSEEAIESALDDLMGQFAESDKDTDEGNAFTAALKKAKDNDEDEMEVDGEKIPVTEFILSHYDYTTGQFPKGETAVLTGVEKDYGEQYIEPAKQFIQAINAKFEEINGYKDPDFIDEGGPITHSIANTEVGQKIAKFFGDAAHSEHGLINLLRKALLKFGPAIYDKMGLSDEEKAKIQQELEADLEEGMTKKICKDCGDEFDHPTTNCMHDSHDPDGDNWIEIDIDGDGQGDIAVTAEMNDIKRLSGL